MEYLVESPLSVPISKNKKFILNLNRYRNEHYQSLSKAKKNYHHIIWPQIEQLPFFGKAQLTLKLYKQRNMRTDRANVLSIHEKFFCDCLVYGDPGSLRKHRGKVISRAGNKLEDDCDEYLLPTIVLDTELDRVNPRVEVIIARVC